MMYFIELSQFSAEDHVITRPLRAQMGRRERNTTHWLEWRGDQSSESFWPDVTLINAARLDWRKLKSIVDECRADNDALDGGDGNDTLYGGAGNDTVFGGEGDDRIVQDLGSDYDTLNGGGGKNTVDYSATDPAGRSSGLTVDLSDISLDPSHVVYVDKPTFGTKAVVGTTGRYIRIYNINTDPEAPLLLADLKVYAGGIDVAKGLIT